MGATFVCLSAIHLCCINYIMKKIVVSFLFFAAFNSQAQKVSGKLSFQKGEKLEMTSNINTTAETPMGENSGSTITTTVYDIKDASAAGATVEQSTKKMKMSISVMGQDKTIDSDNPEDLKGTFGQPVKEMLNKKTEFTIDANGIITAVKEEDKKKSDGNDMSAMFMQQMSPATALLKSGRASFFKILPAYEVGKGDSWLDSMTLEGVVTNITTTVKDITASEIILDYVGNGKIDTKKEMMGMSVDMKGNTKSNGTMTLDKATGLLKQKTDTMISDMTANMSGQEMNIKTKVTTVTTLKVFPPAQASH